MKSLKLETKRNVWPFLVILALVSGAFLAMPGRMRARAVANTITVTNDSSRVMRYVYFSAPDRDNWSADQLSDASLTPGASITLSNADCYDGGVKVVAEDRDGCFVSTVVSCTSNASWTITNDVAPDCGN